MCAYILFTKRNHLVELFLLSSGGPSYDAKSILFKQHFQMNLERGLMENRLTCQACRRRIQTRLGHAPGS